MADFCKACSETLFGKDFRELAGLVEPPLLVTVICEGCGPIQVDADGRCVSPGCLRAGKIGHGPSPGEPREAAVRD